MDVGVSRVSPSWDSSPPSPPASNQGKKGFRGKARRARNVVFVQPAASSSSSPSQVVQEQQRDTQVNAVVRIKGRPYQEGSANGHYDREEQKEEPQPQVISHSCLPQPPTVNCLPLKCSIPMCGESLSAGRMMKLNPWAPEYWPRTSGAGCWVPAEQLTPQLPAVWASSTWLGGDHFLGIGPWPLSGPGPMTPVFGPALGGSANPLWLPEPGPLVAE